jgi:hypothetical protein
LNHRKQLVPTFLEFSNASLNKKLNRTKSQPRNCDLGVHFFGATQHLQPLHAGRNTLWLASLEPIDE